MMIKSYVVDSLREAMPLISEELGKEAIILSTKKVKVGGILGFFKKNKLEVLAALDRSKVEDNQTNQFATLLQSEKERREKVQQVQTNQDDQMLGELKSMKEIMMQLMENERLPKNLKQVNAFLEDQEFSNSIRSSLMANLIVKGKKNPGYTVKDAFVWLKQEFLERMENYPSIRNSDKKIRCFVGPTGVGKTTTIAKLAGDILLNDSKSVGLITSDTYRIAAVEQLRTYGDILDIPLEVVHTAGELNDALEKLSSCDIILIDTAGRNYQQYEYINHIESLFSEKDMSISLVLSLTHRYADMKSITDNFQSIGVTEVIMTKMDETSVIGPIFNMMEDYNHPVTFITNGQSVPDDMIKTTKEILLDLVTEESTNGRSSS